MKLMRLICLLPCVLMTACCTLICVGPLDRNIKPYLHKFEKTGWTIEQRLDDSYSCGATGKYVGIGSIRIKAAQQAGETDRDTESRLKKAWHQCITKIKGYHYVSDELDRQIDELWKKEAAAKKLKNQQAQ